MRFTITLLILIFAISEASKAIKKPKVKRIHSAEICYTQRKIDYEKSRKEAIKQAKEREKELIQAEKSRQKKEQAEADKIFLMQQLEIVSDMLLSVDEELNQINQAINIDIALRSYDKEIKDRRRKEQIVKKLLTLETRQHNLETKLAKSEYIIQAG